ncbi:MAG: glycoside hydrolase family 97 N-terminal domain-containing protein, partial [Prevotella sp.]|nr:glycoside hydrolase family 97 N-terminal domain-containing protein [Prevotella sp.]
MFRFCAALFCVLHCTFCMASTVTSPNGNIELTFTVNQGRPMYSMTFKGKDVVKPSYLGLELAKDKHASKGLKETDLMDGFVLKSEQTSE